MAVSVPKNPTRINPPTPYDSGDVFDDEYQCCHCERHGVTTVKTWRLAFPDLPSSYLKRKCDVCIAAGRTTPKQRTGWTMPDYQAKHVLPRVEEHFGLQAGSLRPVSGQQGLWSATPRR